MHFIHTLLTLLTASVLGAAIGYERQFRQRTAGLRTNTLVATSAAIFVHLAMTIDGSGGAVRVISYVVSGVGFLGAGAIMKEGMNIRGLNTAATFGARSGRRLRRLRPVRRRAGRHAVRARRQHPVAPAGQYGQQTALQ